MPLRLCAVDYAVPGGQTLGAISHPENYASMACAFDPAVTNRQEVLLILFRALRTAARGERFDALRLWPFEAGSEFADLVRGALRGRASGAILCQFL